MHERYIHVHMHIFSHEYMYIEGRYVIQNYIITLSAILEYNQGGRNLIHPLQINGNHTEISMEITQKYQPIYVRIPPVYKAKIMRDDMYVY